MSADKQYSDWVVTQSVELGASAAAVWEVVGGFYTIHLWHPDIERTDVPKDQLDQPKLRRVLTFPGQAPTTEELVSLCEDDFDYRYRWHSGDWGERVQQYRARIRVCDLDNSGRSVMQWTGRFYYTEDALSEFYWNGFRALQERFPCA